MAGPATPTTGASKSPPSSKKASESWQWISEATAAKRAGALIELLALALVVLIGHSMSTVLASIIAVEHPDMVRELVLVHPIYGLASARNMAAFYERLLANPSQAPQMTAEVFDAVMYTPSTPDWVRTWTQRRVLGTPAQSIIGCVAGHAEASGKILGTNDECKRLMRRRRAPRLALCSSDEALRWERELSFREQDAAHPVEEGTFLQIVAHEKINALIVSWLKTLGISGRAQEAKL